MSDDVTLYVRDMPPRLKARLVKLADERQTNMREIAVAALCDAYGLRFTPGLRNGPRPGAATTVTLRVPRTLRRRLRQTAAREDRTMRDVIIGIIDTATNGTQPR